MKKKLLVFCSIIFLWNCESIFIEDLSNLTIVLLAPADNTEVINGSIKFNWQQVSDSVKYNIQIATPSFDAPTQIVLDTITTTTLISKDLEVGDYQWRVKASNSGYSTNYSTSSFKVN